MKLQEYELKKLGQQVVDFADDIRDLTNNGKFAFPIVTGVPAWDADNGEMAFYDGGTSATLPGRRIYVRLSSSWEVFASAGNAAPAPPEGAIQFNSSNYFAGGPSLLWSLANKYVLVQHSNNAAHTALVLVNSQAALAGSLGAALDVKFGVAGETDNALIRVGKLDDYTGSAQSDSYLAFSIDNNGTLTELMRLRGLGVDNSNSTPGVTIGSSSGGRAALEIHQTDPSIFQKGDLLLVYGPSDPPGVPYLYVPNAGGLVVGANDSTVTTPGYTAYLRSRAGSNTPGGSSAAGLALDGSRSVSVPAAITFLYGGANQVGTAGATISFYLISDVGAPYPSSRSLVFDRIDYTQEGVGGGRESPAYIFDDNTLTITADQTFQRNAIFESPFIAGSGILKTVSYAATVFIEGPPLAGNTSANILNAYALWIGSGNVRIGGTIVTGGNATPTVPAGTFFTTTALGVASNNASEITLLRGVIGTTSLVANTLSEGRTIRLQAWGYYNTPTIVPDNLTMRVKLGGTTILTTGAQTPASSVSTGGWHITANIVCQTTGGAGTVFAQGEFPHQSTSILEVNWQMTNSSTSVINTTAANVLEITAQWAGASSASQLVLTNAVGELLN